jgi:pimeloyl-ACP methyl ester carboxylesterase
MDVIIRTIKLALAVLPALFTTLVQAEQVSLTLSDNIVATAEYERGEPGRPLVVFIHGFLQTHEFSTVHRLHTAINQSGYPVLSPTLSLGISNRAQSIPCESIHLHSLDNDSYEIERWVKWAENKGYQDIILVGHSAGSVNITSYLARNHNHSVSKSILISLTYYGPGRPAAFENEAHAEKARDMLKRGDNNLQEFALAFCKKYVSTADRFLSYYDWSDDRIIETIDRSRSKDYVIIGSADDRITQGWLSKLEKSTAEVIVIDEASHFFDKSQEFDLHDAVEDILEAE